MRAIGILLLTLLYPRIGYPISIGITLVAVMAVSVVSWRWVEEPSKRVSRRLLRAAEQRGRGSRLVGIMIR